MSTPVSYLIRQYYPTHTTGALIALDKRANLLMSCVTLEMPWRDNLPQKSCFPEGIYQVVYRHSPKHEDHYHILDVPGRELILFHPATFVHQLLGCTIPGARFTDLNADGIPDIVNTRATLNKMLAVLGTKFTLHVLSAPMPGGTLPEALITAAT